MLKINYFEDNEYPVQEEDVELKESNIENYNMNGEKIYDVYSQYLNYKNSGRNEHTQSEVKAQIDAQEYANSFAEEDLPQSEAESECREYMDYKNDEDEYFVSLKNDEISELSYVITEEEYGTDVNEDIRGSHYTDANGFHYVNYRTDAVEGTIEKDYVLSEGTVLKRMSPKDTEVDTGTYLTDYNTKFEDLQLPQFENYYQTKFYVVNQEFKADKSKIASQGWQDGQEAYQYKLTEESIDGTGIINVHRLAEDGYLSEIAEDELDKYIDK